MLRVVYLESPHCKLANLGIELRTMTSSRAHR
jgi:hypothetical protein